MPDVFISYARENTDFVRDLVAALRENNRDVWVDFDDIPFGSDWWNEIVEGIEQSSVGIFVISEDSIHSQYCSLEIAQLMKNQKKLIPIVAVTPVEAHIEKLPQKIRDLNWIYFDKGDEFDSVFTDLITTMDTDLSGAKAHTQLLMRALDWQKRSHTKDSLARGDELAGFLPLLERDDLTLIQESFLEASLQEAQARYNFWRFVFGFLGGLLAMAFYVAAATRATTISPSLVTNIIAAGEVFGLFTGIIAVFGSSLPEFIKRRLPESTHLPIRIIVCFVAGMMTWITFQWFFLFLPPVPTWASFLGGIGISIGFIINTVFKPPPIVTFAITALAMYASIFFLNNFAEFYNNSGLINPLIYFGEEVQVYTIGIPMVLLYAFGTNAHILWQSIGGVSEVTQYLEGRLSKQKNDLQAKSA